MDMQTTPRLRFKDKNGKDFSDWEEKKLGEITTFSKGRGVSKKDIVKDGKNKCIRYGELYTNYKEVINTIASLTNVSTQGSLLSNEDDVLIPSSGETAIDIATASCVKIPNVIIGGDLNVLRLKNCSGEYMAYYLSINKKRNIARLSQGVSIIHLYASHLKSLQLKIPSLSEQQKIADFLGSVDSWIENLESQKQSLKDYKKGIMQKIFSQEIKFKDKDGKDFPDWEEKMLCDIGKIKTSSVDKKSNPNEKPVNLLNYMDAYKRDHILKTDLMQQVTAKDNQINSSLLKKGDVLFTPSSETPVDIGHSAVVMDDLKNTVFSYHLMRLRPIDDSLLPVFCAYAFKSFVFYKKLWRLAQGATRFTLSIKALNTVTITIPVSKKEQQKIADFLSSIDNLINSKEKQIDKAKEWKKGLMQQMFV